jgi:SpoVK/Ycf46/Vps4 family AAA+-type ATPase
VDLALYHNSYHNIFTIINDSTSSFKLLLYGKPGTGKSSIAKVLAAQFTVDHITDLSIKFNINPATVYIIDDVDLLLSGRDGDSNGKKNLANLLSILDKAERVILTTNKVESLDEAVTRPGRINHAFEIGHIDVESAKVIIKMTFADICGLETLPNEVETKQRFSLFNRAKEENYKFLFYEFLDEVTEDVLARVLKDSTDGSLSPARVKHTTKYFVNKCKSMYTESLSVDADTSHLQVDENLKDFYTFRKDTLIAKVHRNFSKVVNFYNTEISDILDMVIKIDDDSNNCDSRKFDFNKKGGQSVEHSSAP